MDIIHRRDEFRAGAILLERATNNEKIQFVYSSSVVEEILGEEKVEAVRIRDVKTGEETVHPTDGVFIFIGHTPNTQLYTGTN